MVTATTGELLAAYDSQLRLEAEMVGALSWHRHGPLVRGVLEHGGFVSYRELGVDGDDLDRLIAETVAWYRDETDVASFEWKTRGHDRPADLPERLVAHGFVPDPAETVMMGRADLLARPLDLPAGITLRRAGEGGDLLDDVARASRLQTDVFGRDAGPDARLLAARLAAEPDRTGLWLAEDAAGMVVCAGRLEVVPGTDVAGLWGGATSAAWRGRGIYRAVVAARAQAALALGVVHLHSDCTEMSRPILERSGLVAVTTTTPYLCSLAPPRQPI
ncbi:GNAT family N-acetyltransferase [Nocardioides sp. zg-579]|uniref:GNAT family N-acetyltransferase n=1 Tax=Nocardioides marmotae TaxID=2663857 RepID=A0A6I3J0Y3_9ACTN|nr:GNAT family N-acetyltransferase [Gordonia jinghuaiqii]MTB95177.1 GNAT family N-acetyltransferase [Nocardioides marmotae]